MFGGGSTWGQNNNNNQQQQQPQQGGLFGGGGFGQQQQQQQQPQQTGFGSGGFGQQPAATGGGLFGGNTQQTSTFGGGGGFGAAAQPTSTFGAARPTFGATGQSTFGATPATGGGLFGNTSSTFGGASNQPATGGMFGAKPAQTNTFGSGATSGLFGAKPASPFGAANTGSTQAQNPNTSNPYYGDRPAPAPPTTGTADPAYFPSWQQDPSGTSSTSNLPPHLFHNVSAMEAYRGASPDELRAMDYQQNRKNATPQQPAAGGFGAPATGGFGQAAPTNTFGQQPATSTFGAKPAGGMFGAAPAANTGFGQSSGGFGQSSTGGGMFGQTQQQPASTGFGQPAQTGGLFGQPAQAPATGGGLFGNTSTGFGAQPAQPAATNTFGSFGAAKPATTGFGAPAAGGFGSGPATNTFGQTPAAGTGSTFGGFGATQNQNQQQAPATGGLFGGGGGFGQNNQQQQPAAATGGLFGQPAQQPAQPAAGGLFGAAAPKPGGLFGGASTTPAAGASTGFSFGQNNTQQPAQTGGLFGSTNNTNNNTTGGGLFGTQNNQQQGAQQPAAGGLFGGGGGMFGAKPAAPATGGLFGSTTQNQQQPVQTGSLFGNTGQSSGGLFGSTNNTLGQQNQQQNQPKPGGLFGGGGGMFGQTQQQPQQNTTGGGLFGGLGQSQPAQTSLFGNQNQQQPQQNGMNSSLFGGLGQSTNNQSQQPSLNASIDQNPYGRNELFNYTGQKLEFGSQNKKPALPPLTASSYRITPSKNQINKLRGFATPQSPGRASSPLSSSSRNGLNSPASDRYKGLTDTALTPNAFIPRPSIKRLNVTPKTNGVNGDDHLESVLGKSALKSSTSRSNLNVSQNGLSNSATLTFNPPSSLTATNGNGNGNQDTPTRRPTPLESSRPLAVAGSERQPSQGQYWCKPRMEKLRQMGEGYLSKIPNFTIGRSGFGEVTFLEPVDVTAFDLNDLFGKVVVFTEMELAVYPDDWEDKPPQGQGLNRPARITLLNCYPRDKATKQFITDVNDPRHARFLKRVKNIPETEFVSYTADGAWTFEVKHFSKYGLRDGSDEDDEDVGDVGAIKRKTVNNGPKSAKAREAYNRPPSRTPSRTPESDEDFLPPTKSIRDMEQDVEEEESVSEGEGSETASEQDSASDQDQASSSRSESGSAPPEYNGMEPAQLKLGPEGFKNLQEMQSAHFDFEPRHIRPEKRQVKRTLGSHLAGFGNAGEDEKMLDRAIKRPSFGLKPSAPVLRQARKYAKVSLADGVESGKEGVKVDAGLAMGRSFRCSWGPNGELVHFGKICSPFTKFTPSSGAEVIIENVSILTEDAETESSRAQRLLRLHLDHSTIQTFDGIPQATLSTSIRFRDFASVFDTGDRSHEATIFRLGQALFDEIDLLLPPNSPDELVERISQLRRKLALSKWLENAVAPSVDSDLIKNGENRAAKVFSLLSGNKVARAVDMALEGNDMRLASLISQAGRTGEFRDEMLRQLSDWNKYDANPLIATEYRRLYALLAGIMDVSPSRSGDISISKDLDWKRAFGLYLWFGCPFESTITEVFDEFTNALNSPHPPAEPLPPFLESKSEVKWNIPSQPTDITYQLIRVFSDATVSLDQVLQPRNCSASPTDLRLPWHLYLILSRVMQKRDFVDRDEEGYSALADGITQGYAAQLELGGQWLNAAFVLLHLETIEGREKAIRALLHRHPDPSSEDVAFLTTKLEIPVQWIHESDAASLASSGDAGGEYHALLKAELWNRAHRVLIDKLAPEAVLRGDMALLGRLCEGLVGKVDGWEYGGQLFIDYINTTTEVPLLLKEAITTRQIQPRLTQLANDLPRLLRLLPALFPGEGVQSVACLSDMLSALHHLAGQLSLGGLMTRPAVSDSMVDVDRLHLLQASAFDAFSAALEGVTA